MSPLRAARTALYRTYARLSPWYRSGRLREWRELFATSERWSRDELASWQTQRLRALLEAAETTAFYPERLRAAGLSSATLASLDDLARLPTVEKREISRDPARLHTRRPPPFRSGATSGSTGVPLRLRTSAEMDAAGRAVYWRIIEWFGVPFGSATLRFVRGDREHPVRDALAFEIAGSVLGQSLSDHYVRPFEHQLRLLATRRPRVVLASPNVVEGLARVAAARGVDLSRFGVEVVVLGGESLSAEQRSVIGRAFGCPVASLYGSGEGNYMAVECPRGRLHVAEPLLLEIVDDDGKRLAEGTEGEIVITPLLGHAMPLLRYRMGDRGRRVAGPCPCGRGLPGLSLDVTRTSDTVVLPGGRRASSKFFDPLLNNAFGRRFGVDPIAFRVIQRATERFEIELMLPPGAELPPRAQAFVRTHVRSVLGDGVEVQLTRVSRIDPDPAGKLRCFIPLGEPSSPA